jgi:hypothetical protein
LKRFIAVVISALFVLGFAATAFAIHAEIPAETQAVFAKGTTMVSLHGAIRIRGEYRSNTTDFNDDMGDNFAAYDERVRFGFSAKPADNAEAYLLLESNYYWGTGTGDGPDSAQGVYAPGTSDSKRGDFMILEGWVLYKMDTVGIKVGHMPLALGNKLFFEHIVGGDDAVVIFADPSKQLHLGLLTAKFAEGTNTLNDDADAYVGLFVYKADNFGVSGDVTYVNDKTIADGLHFWNIGLRGDIKAGDFSLKGDVELQTGSAEDGVALGTDLDFSGYAVLIGADYNFGNTKIGAEFATGSGDDNTDNDYEEFVTSLSNVQHFTYVYDYRAIGACGGIAGVSTDLNNGLCNTTYLKGYIDSKISDNLSLYAALYWLQATEDVLGEDEIGAELDAKVSYKLARNLNYWVEGGYLFAGDLYGTNADNAFAVRHGIELTF